MEGAKEKMDALASALQNGEIDCDYVMVTKDFHPSNHCSFKENGGQWPPHCVKDTTGSCIYAPLWSVICNYAYRKDTDIFIKGDSPDKVTLYEVPVLAIISELRNRVLGNNCDMSEVIKKLEPNECCRNKIL